MKMRIGSLSKAVSSGAGGRKIKAKSDSLTKVVSSGAGARKIIMKIGFLVKSRLFWSRRQENENEHKNKI